jgi:hypothetical protein
MNIINYDHLCYSDEQCLKQANILKRVMFEIVEIKKGRGKKAYVIKEYMYNSEGDDEVREKILNTIKHYETKMETLSKEDNK